MKVISFEHVDKYFFLQHQKTLKEFFQAIFVKEKTMERVHAIKNLTFSVSKGEVLGVIGKNGAGKSTLLKLIAGVSQPTSGSITINGTLAPLIELGAGFHPELSGRENIFLNGIILGMTEKMVAQKLDSIVEFSEIGEFLDMPVKHYSSGMFIRLAFSIAVSVEPEILLIDEVLSVGDYEFQQKSLAKMKSFRNNDTSIVFVSHDLETVKSFCDRVLVLDKGELKFVGDPVAAMEVYHSL